LARDCRRSLNRCEANNRRQSGAENTGDDYRFENCLTNFLLTDDSIFLFALV